MKCNDPSLAVHIYNSILKHRNCVCYVYKGAQEFFEYPEETKRDRLFLNGSQGVKHNIVN
jgi:hypothetical protein